MLNFLNKPYPFNDDLKHNARVVLFISLGVLAFLVVFQPVEIKNLSRREISYLAAGFAGSTFLVLTLNLIIIPSLFNRLFSNINWDIKKEILWNTWIILAISSSDLLIYSELFGIIDITFNDILRILLLGFIPVAVLIIINQDRLMRSHLKSADMLNRKLIESKQQKAKLVHFESDYRKDDLIISPESLLAVKSADNYIEVYYYSDNHVKKQMVRSSLDRTEKQLSEFDFILRCHRSYIVNINYINEIRGNSQGYILSVENLDFNILVSQRYINELKKMI